MKTFIALFVLLTAAATFHLSTAAEGATWGYDEHHGDGPSKWKDNYPKCDGKKQSPINIVMPSTQYDAALTEFQFRGYDTSAGYAYELTNNGHTAQLNIKAGDMTIEGGGLPNQFQLAQLHFHWGSTNAVGSEHTLNGKSFPLEVHLVHFNKVYNNLTTAVPNDNGLAVLGIFFEIGDTTHETLQKILDRFGDITNAGYTVNVAAFPLQGLLPTNRRQFVRYSGSLTTPGCYESVTWTVFREPIKISQTQMNRFRSLNHNAAGQSVVPIVDNFRPVQALNQRRVTRSYQQLDPADAAAGSAGHIRSTVVVTAFAMWVFSVVTGSL